MQEIGKYIFLIGIVLVVFAALAWRFRNIFQWVGKLPGDISIRKGSFSLYFPIVTCTPRHCNVSKDRERSGQPTPADCSHSVANGLDTSGNRGR